MHPRLARWFFAPSLFLRRAWHRAAGRAWWAPIEPHVLMGAFPTAEDARVLAALGVRGVVNLCAERRGPRESYAALGLEELHLPVVDFESPTHADVDAALAFMARHVDGGARVYVHCKAGRGRSATVVLCWIVERSGASPEEAMRTLRAASPFVVAGLERRAVVRARQRGVAARGAGIG